MLLGRRRFLERLGAASLFLRLPPGKSLGADASGDEIALEAERVNQGFGGERSSFTLVLLNAQGDRTERRLTLELREDLADGNRSRIEFDWPENVRGTILLTHAHEEGEDDQWLYLPASKRMRRISAGHKTGSFMGSEFTYEDLAPPVASKYTHTRRPDGAVDGRACYELERRSRREGSGYSRQLVRLDKEHLVPLTVEYYDRKNELLKVALYRDYQVSGSYRRAQRVRMENRQTKKTSELQAIRRELGVELDADRFRSQVLGR
jgi:hypothetical protein